MESLSNFLLNLVALKAAKAFFRQENHTFPKVCPRKLQKKCYFGRSHCMENDTLRKCVLLSNGHRKWWSLRIEGLKGAGGGHKSVGPIVKGSVALSAEHKAIFATSCPTQGDRCCKDPRLEPCIKMTSPWFRKTQATEQAAEIQPDRREMPRS